MNLLNLDARWRRLNDPEWMCPQTGVTFGGVFDLGFDHPTNWVHAERGDVAYVKEGADQLSSELCRFGDERYLCAIVSLPIQGSEETVNISVWVKVPHGAFYAYLESFDGAAMTSDLPAVLANDLPNLANLGADITLSFRAADTRPVVSAVSGDLARAGDQGISFDQLLDLYAAFGHDIRPLLTQD